MPLFARLLATVLLVVVSSPPQLAAQTEDSDAETPQRDEAVVTERVAVDYVADDQAIQKRLRRILRASNWFESVDVEVQEGIVILNGTTDDTQHRVWAADVARRTEDVVAVVNNITVSDELDVSRSLSVVSSSLETLWKDFLRQLPLVIAALAVIVVTWLAGRIGLVIVTKTAERSRLRGGLRDLARQLTICGIWVAGIMIAAVVMFPGMTPAKLLTVLGLSSVAIGFAFKDIFENFFAGVLILWRFPFDKGDFIECGEVCGRVEDITVRMTSIRQVDGQLVVLPNAMLFKQAVYVLTSQNSRRVTIICGVAYGEDVATARSVIRQAVEDCDAVHRDHEIEIFAREFADSSVNFEVTFWCGSTPLEERQARDQVVESVKHALDQAGIEIPFPYRTLTFKQPLRVGGASDIVSESPEFAAPTTSD